MTQPPDQRPGFLLPGQPVALSPVPTAMPAPPRRPGWVTALGVLTIVFGSLSLLAVIQNVALGPWMRQHQPHVRQRQPGVQFVEDVQDMTDRLERYGFVTAITGSILGAMGVAGGVGLLKVRPWGRSLALAYAIASIANVGLMVVLGGMSGPLVLVVMGCAGLLGLAYPIVLLCFLLPRRRAAVFARPGPGPAMR